MTFDSEAVRHACAVPSRARGLPYSNPLFYMDHQCSLDRWNCARRDEIDYKFDLQSTRTTVPYPEHM